MKCLYVRTVFTQRCGPFLGTNTFCELDKYILNFEQIYLSGGAIAYEVLVCALCAAKGVALLQWLSLVRGGSLSRTDHNAGKLYLGLCYIVLDTARKYMLLLGSPC